jgi:hypothetical protein
MSGFIIFNSIQINTLDCPYAYEMYYSHFFSYFVRGSDIDDVRPDRISVKRNFKMGWVVPDNQFWPRKECLSLGEICRKYEGTSKWQFKEEALCLALEAGHLDLYLLVSNTTGGDARVPESDLKKWSNEV